jgi:acetolactate synthase-1/2/3 large subunit
VADLAGDGRRPDGGLRDGASRRGRGRLQLERVPYNTDLAVEALRRFDHIVLVNAKPPVGFFAYPGKPSTHYRADTQLHVLTRPDQDPVPALEMLAQLLRAPPAAVPDPGPRPSVASGPPTPDKLASTLAALMPENAIVSDESVSYGRGFYRHTHAAPPHDWLHLVGGAIGAGLPVATGAAIAARGERRVISLQADGSALYSLQSLWTQARERLPNTTIILNNRSYAILVGEYAGVGAAPGPTAMSMLDLGNPPISWTKLANGLGVEAGARRDDGGVRRPDGRQLRAARPLPHRADDVEVTRRPRSVGRRDLRGR